MHAMHTRKFFVVCIVRTHLTTNDKKEDMEILISTPFDVKVSSLLLYCLWWCNLLFLKWS